MRRLLSFFGSALFAALLCVGLSVPFQYAQAAEACQFQCRVTLGSNAANCDPVPNEGGLPTVQYTACSTQCQNLCNSLGMGYDTSRLHASTCQTREGVSGRGICSPCSCIPNSAIACVNTTSGGGSNTFCAGQCSTVCSARAADVTRLQGSGSGITCATGLSGSPQCVAVDQPAAVRLCRACIETCVNDTSGNVQRTPRTCYTECRGSSRQAACQGVSEIEANIQGTTSTGGSGGTGTSGRSGGGTTGGGTTNTTRPSAQATQGTCSFNCQPQVPRTTCQTDQDCASTCQQVCGRSFRNGQCPTTGPGAARCVEVGSGMPKQCAFECSIGASQQERSCNPLGTGAQAPGTVCGGFCEESCRSAATERPASSVRFCGGSAPTCFSAGGSPGTNATPTNPGTSEGESGAGTGVRLPNPIPGVDSIAGLVGRIIKGILGVVGSIALLMFVYGGIKWILSAGDAKEVTAAQNVLRNATVGLILIFFSYSISNVILGFLNEIGTGSSSSPSTNGSTTGSSSLASCVEYAVSHGYIGRNEAQDLTNPSWACRQTQSSERTNRSVCIRNGCPNDPANVLCCAPLGGTNAGTGTTQTAPTGSAPRATAGCRTTVQASFHLRATETADSTGASISGGTQVEVIAPGTVVRSGTLIHNVRLVSDTSRTGWMFLTSSEVAACRAP